MNARERPTLRGIPPPPIPSLHDHERRLRAVEAHVFGIREDVAFIRGQLTGGAPARSSVRPSAKQLGATIGAILGALSAAGAAIAAAKGWL
jgi:hypothetical protein